MYAHVCVCLCTWPQRLAKVIRSLELGYRWLWAAQCGSFGREARALSCWTIALGLVWDPILCGIHTSSFGELMDFDTISIVYVSCLNSNPVSSPAEPAPCLTLLLGSPMDTSKLRCSKQNSVVSLTNLLSLYPSRSQMRAISSSLPPNENPMVLPKSWADFSFKVFAVYLVESCIIWFSLYFSDF